jgi:hypothetical protein
VVILLRFPVPTSGSVRRSEQTIAIGANERVVHLLGTPFTHDYYAPRLETLLLQRYAHRGLVYRRVAVSGPLQDLVENLDARVLAHRPTFVVLQAGNDDLFSQRRRPTFDFTAYPQSLKALVKRLRERKIRVVVCSVVPVANGSAPDRLLPPMDGLKTWVDAAREIASRHGAIFVDLFTEAIGWEMIGQERYFRRHYSPEGHERSWQLLSRQLRFTPEGSTARIDVRRRRARAEGAAVTELRVEKDGISFSLLNAASAGSVMLHVEGLPAGDYVLEVDGKRLGSKKAEELAAGIDLRDHLRSRVETPDLRAELARGHTATAEQEAIRAYRLPDWVKLAEFEAQQAAARRRAAEALDRHDAAVRERVRPRPMAVRLTSEAAAQ